VFRLLLLLVFLIAVLARELLDALALLCESRLIGNKELKYI
jgi:hypothetical protein